MRRVGSGEREEVGFILVKELRSGDGVDLAYRRHYEVGDGQFRVDEVAEGDGRLALVEYVLLTLKSRSKGLDQGCGDVLVRHVRATLNESLCFEVY